MIRNQWKPYSELKSIQDRKLKRIIRHAYAHVPFYKELFDAASLRPEDISCAEDLSRIPVTTKKQIQESPEGILTSRVHSLSKCVQVTTSGSSGTPLRLFYEKSDFSRLNMNWIRPLLAHGVKPWHKKMEITGPHNISAAKSWYNYLGLWKTRAVSVFKNPGEWLELMISCRPDFLYGYSGSLKLLAQYIQKSKSPPPIPRFVFGVSDLVDQECRDLIETVFGKKLIDLYGSAEAGCIAWQCPLCRGYHINMDTVVVEFLEERAPALGKGMGRILVTNLHSYAMPVIRYDLEDIGSASNEKNVCGRELPLMKVIEGRDDSFVVLPSGNMLSPMFFFGIMKPIRGISRWRIHQDSEGRISVLIVPSPEFSPKTISSLQHRIRAHIEEDIRLEIQTVDHLAPDPSGKVRAVVSKMHAS